MSFCSHVSLNITALVYITKIKLDSKNELFSQIDIQEKRNFLTHSDLSVEINDEVNRLKALRDILTLTEYIIDSIRRTTTDFYQKVVQKSPNETRACHSV